MLSAGPERGTRRIAEAPCFMVAVLDGPVRLHGGGEGGGGQANRHRPVAAVALGALIVFLVGNLEAPDPLHRDDVVEIELADLLAAGAGEHQDQRDPAVGVLDDVSAGARAPGLRKAAGKQRCLEQRAQLRVRVRAALLPAVLDLTLAVHLALERIRQGPAELRVQPEHEVVHVVEVFVDGG